jgi:UDP-N-acetylglucosamine transferase subunit ALG13
LSSRAKINNPDAKVLKVLVAPLDWGLGHATRCIPIINEFLSNRCTVILAADGAQKALLQEEFPTLSFVQIPGYRIKYGKNRAFTLIRLIMSIPKILIRVKQENAWLRGFASQDRPDLIISDNRYGLYLPGIVSVFITHQLSIRTSFGAVADRLLQRVNYRAIRRFTLCWVPDVAGEEISLAGKLSHSRRMPAVPTRYIGWLSRFGAAGAGAASAGAASVGGGGPVDLLVVLSGPEPQRTLLEKMILEQAAGCGCEIVLVRGLPGGGAAVAVPSGVLVYDHLAARELESLICRSSMVLARSGYSTVMDLARLGKKAIFIPTPGQTEQEYLGTYLAGKGLAVSMGQDRFSLKEAVDRARELVPGGDWGLAAKKNLILGDEVRAVLKLAGGLAGGLAGSLGDRLAGDLADGGDQSDAADLG